jgi:hypothetical protein
MMAGIGMIITAKITKRPHTIGQGVTSI